jgi:Single-strand binding protein family
MSLALSSLLCSACGTVAIPRVAPGTGPHVAKAVCADCGRFLKWLPQVAMKETQMVASVNRVVLVGAISKHGVEVSYHGQGTAKASFMLVLTELGSDSKEHQLWQPVEIWGKRAEHIGELDAGTLVLVDGKLRRSKKGENWETVVSGFDCTPLHISTAVATAG